MVGKSMKKTQDGWQRRFVSWALVLALLLSLMPMSIMPVQAAGTPLGNISAVSRDTEFENANANTKAYIITTANSEKVRLVFYKDDLFRIWLADNNGKGAFTESDPADLPTSQMWDLGGITDVKDLEIVVKRDFGAVPDADMRADTGYYEFKTQTIALRAYSTPFRFELRDISGNVIWSEADSISTDASSTLQTLRTDDSEYFYGGGMQVGYFSHKGRKINIKRGGWLPGEAPNPVPFYMSTKGYGVFRNTYKNGVYDFTSNAEIILKHDEKRFDAFYFYGPTFEKILDGYTELTGRPSLIPRWSIGLGDASAYRQMIDTTAQGGNPKNGPNQKPEQEPYGGFWSEKGTGGVVDDYVSQYYDKDMPLSWMLPNDGYGCEYNKETHPGGSLGDAAEGLMAYNIRTGLWVGEPGNYTDKNYTYGFPSTAGQAEKKDAFNREITAQVKDWLVRLYKIDVAWSSQKGLKGDMGIFNQMHTNIEKNSGDRGLLITVYGWAGAQRYATIWSGDQSGTDDYVQYHIPSFLGASMSGFPFHTSDQGAIFHDNPGVYVRDLQMKTLVPLNYAMNNWGNGTTNGNPPQTRSTSDKRPASSIHFTPEEIESNRKYMKLKQQLVPYMYSYARQAYDHGTPIVRPLVYNFQNDPVTYDTRTQYQYMSGDWILAAPVYDPNATVRDNIYLPAGRWIDYWSGEEYFGPTTISVDAPMDKLPMFIRGGAIVPMAQESLYDGQEEYNGKIIKDTIIFDLYPEGTTTFSLYEDDGHSIKYKTEDAYTKTLITSSAPSAGITGPLTVTVGAAQGRAFEGQVDNRKNLMVIHTPVKPGNVRLGGETGAELTNYGSYSSFEEAPNGGWFYDAGDKGGILYVKTPSLPISTETVVWVDKFIANGAPELENALQLAANVTAKGVSKDAVSVSWEAIPGATNYNIEIDGMTIIENVTSPYLHMGLAAESTHQYRIMGKNATQKSGWTQPVYGTALADPDFYLVPKSGMSATCSNTTNYGGGVVGRAIDGDTGSQFHTGTAISGNENMDINLGGLFMIDKFVYTPRADKGNGTVRGYTLYTSLNGVDYTEVAKGTWSYDDAERGILTSKEVKFEPTLAKHLRFQKNTSVGNFFSAQEVYVYRSQKNIVLNSLTTGKEATASSVWRATDAALSKVAGITATAADADSQTGGGYVASYAADGVTNDEKGWRITPGRIPAALNINLPGDTEIYSVKYYPLIDACEKRDELGPRGGDVTGYALYAVDSNDRTVWLAGGTWEPGAEPKTINFRPIVARRLQFVVTSAQNDVGAVAEFEVYKKHEAEPVPYEETPVSANEMTATANSVGESHQPGRVITGEGWQSNYSNDWNSARWPAWVNIKFDAPKTVTKIDYTPRSGGSNGRIKGYKVMYSTDGGQTYFEGGRGIGRNNTSVQQLVYNYPYPVTDIRIQSAVFDDLLMDVSGAPDTSYAFGNGGNWFIQKLEFYEDTTRRAEEDPTPNTLVAQGSWTVKETPDSEAGSNKESLKDNDKNTFWASEPEKAITAPDKWTTPVIIDLGAEKMITKVEYTPRQDSSNGRLRGYAVYAAGEDENYALAGMGYAYNTTNVQSLEYNLQQPIRYIKIQNSVFGAMGSSLDKTDNPAVNTGAWAYGNGKQISIAELNFYEVQHTGNSVNLLDPEASYAPQYAVDNRSDTGWSSIDTQTAILTVDLGESKTFDMARVLWGKEFGTNYTLEASEDGETWSNLATVSNNSFDEGYYKFTPATARYVRINGTASNRAFTVRSFDIFGDDGVTSIALDASAVINVGEALTLHPVIIPITARDQTLSWSSSDETVASVDPVTGKIKGLKPGQTTITAVSAANPEIKATCELTVNAVLVAGVTINPDEKVLGVGESVQLEVKVSPDNATNKNVIWSSSDPAIAGVLQSGFVTAKAKGTAQITATSQEDSSKTAVFNVRVGDIVSMEIDNSTRTLEVAFDTLPTEVKKILFTAAYDDGTGALPMELVNMTINSAESKVSFNYDRFLPNSQSRVEVTVKYKDGAAIARTVMVEQAYTVTFDSQDADVGATPGFKKVIPPAVAIDALPADPVKNGYTFGGWYTAKDGEGTEFQADTAISADITVYARWIPNEHTIVFETDGGSEVDPMKAAYNSLLAEPTSPVKEGYRLMGWYKDASLSMPWNFETDVVKGDFTLYAKWIKTYTVSFVTNGGSSLDSIVADSGALMDKPADPAWEGKSLAGWYKDEELTVLWDFDADTVTQDMTLYAKWVDAGISTVVFESNGGSTVAPQAVENGKKPLLVQPVKFGYLFTGWYKDSSCTEPWNIKADFVTKDMTLFAGWEKLIDPTFHYSFNSTEELNRTGPYGVAVLMSHMQAAGEGVNGSGALSMAAGGNIRIDSNEFDYKTKPFTISFWVNPESVEKQQYLFTSNPGDDWILVKQGGNISLYLNGVRETNTVINAARWTQLTFVQSKDPDKFTIYVDGVMSESFDIAPSYGTPGQGNYFSLGAKFNSAAGNFVGKMDEVRFYEDVALSEAQVKGLYESDITYSQVVDIVGVQSAGTNSVLNLDSAFTVSPDNATNKIILWSLKDDNSTGASLNGSVLNTSGAGIVIVTATVEKGLSATSDFMKDIAISVTTNAGIIANISDLSKTYDGNQVGLPMYEYNGDGEVAITYHRDNDGVIGEVLDSAPVNAGSYWVRLSATATGSYEAAEGTARFTISKADSAVPQVSGLTGTEGQQLSTVSLSDYTGLSWKNPETVLAAGIQSYAASYTQDNDAVNYKTLTVMLEVTVSKESPPPTPEPEQPAVTSPVDPVYRETQKDVVKVGIEVNPVVNADSSETAKMSEQDAKKLAEGITVAKAASADGKELVVEIKGKFTRDVKNASVVIPDIVLASAAKADAKLNIDVGGSSVTFDRKAVSVLLAAANGGDATLAVAKVENNTLSKEFSGIIGNRPAYKLEVKTGDLAVTDFEGGKVVIVLDYPLNAGEDANCIVAYHVDENGKLLPVRSKYDSASGKIQILTGHFAAYAVGYNPVVFRDVEKDNWFKPAVDFIAARGITSGIGNGEFGSHMNITRADFTVMLMKAFNIDVSSAPSDNFADAGDKYYTEYLAVAKKMGIASGVGNNRFNPEGRLTREEMFALVYKVLVVMNELPEAGKTNLSAFSDAGQISDYFTNATQALVGAGIIKGSNGKLNPKAEATRAEMAQVLYELLK